MKILGSRNQVVGKNRDWRSQGSNPPREEREQAWF